MRPILGYSPDADRDFREADELSRRALDSDPADPMALNVAAYIPVILRRDYQTGWGPDRSFAGDQSERCAFLEPSRLDQRLGG